MYKSPQSDDPLFSEQPRKASSGIDGNVFGDAANAPGRSALEVPELEAALQLLVERAQYITGATGTALALPENDEMICRASAGSCAPAVGAHLQVRSGLTGESIARRQLLRCDNAETDPRVNLEACRALGIESIVVLPLLRRNGEIRGLFELFSDHPYAFEERDLIALERMADLTLTALDLAEQRHGSVPPPPSLAKQAQDPQAHAMSANASGTQSSAGFASAPAPAPSQPAPPQSLNVQPPVNATEPSTSSSVLSSPVPGLSVPTFETPAQPAKAPDGLSTVQKCVSCGFPVSEGRTLCLDCEKLDLDKKERYKRLAEEQSVAALQNGEEASSMTESSVAPTTDVVLPPFLANATPVKESWMSNHVNLLAILVLIVGILVAVVVFR